MKIDWRDKNGRVVARSTDAGWQVAAPGVSKSRPQSPEQLEKIARLLAAEAMDTEDLALRSRLLNRAGSVAIRAQKARAARPAMKLTPEQIEETAERAIAAAGLDNRWMAEARFDLRK